MARIAVVHHTGQLGGGTSSFMDILSMLTPTHEVLAISPQLPSAVLEASGLAGVQFLAPPAPFPLLLNFRGGPRVLHRGFLTGAAQVIIHRRAWKAFFARIDADFVVVNSSVLVPLGKAAQRAGAGAVCVVRETINERGWRTRITASVLSRWFDGVIYISDFDRAHGLAPSLPSRTIRDCVRPLTLRRMSRESAADFLGIEVTRFNVLFAGGASWIKGLDVALEAVKALPPRVQLIVAGYPPGSRPSPLKRLVSRLTSPEASRFNERVEVLLRDPVVRGRVAFVGPQSDMSACYSVADALIFPAVVPHQAKPLIEAAHFDLPIVCTDYPQYGEHVDATFRIPAAASDQLADALASILANSAGCSTAAKRNRGVVEARHDYFRSKRLLLDFVAVLLRQRPALRQSICSSEYI